MTRDDYEILQEWLDRKAKNNPYARTAAFKYETGYKEGLLTSRLANEIFTERWGRDERTYKKELAEAVKAAVREHEDELLERAIPRAAEYMGSRGLKKLVAKITEGGEP